MISIAMTTYNGEKYIERQLESIFSQTLPADEIIICDDASKDRTVEIINRFIEKNQTDKIRLVHNQENLGYIRNFHKAISLTRGDYIFLADQDDVWHADKIEQTLQVLKDKNASVVCTNCNLIDDEGNDISDSSFFDRNPFVDRVTEKVSEISFFELIVGNIAQGCTYCFTKDVKDIYLVVNSEHLEHDHQIMFVAALQGKAYFLDEALLDYRLHGNNTIGFGSAEEAKKIHWKIPKLKPVMVRFLEDLNRGLKVPHFGFYKLLYYFRIPYFISVYRRRQNSDSISAKEIGL